MPLHTLQHSKYANHMLKICIYMLKICSKYAFNMQKICHYIDFNIANMQIICKKYAQYATKICNKYAINMQNMHKSMYLHILHIYALPTLLMG